MDSFGSIPPSVSPWQAQIERALGLAPWAAEMPQSLLDDLSATIGEMRGFMQQQQTKNDHIEFELKNIADIMLRSSNLSATFVEYRNVLHERFNRIADQLGDINHNVEKLEQRVAHNEILQEDIIKQLADWTGSFRSWVAISLVITSIIGSMLGYVAPLLFKALGKI